MRNVLEMARRTGRLILEWPYNNPEGNNQYSGGGASVGSRVSYKSQGRDSRGTVTRITKDPLGKVYHIDDGGTTYQVGEDEIYSVQGSVEETRSMNDHLNLEWPYNNPEGNNQYGSGGSGRESPDDVAARYTPATALNETGDSDLKEAVRNWALADDNYENGNDRAAIKVFKRAEKLVQKAFERNPDLKHEPGVRQAVRKMEKFRQHLEDLNLSSGSDDMIQLSDSVARDKALKKVGLVAYMAERFDLDPEAAAELVDSHPEVMDIPGGDYEGMVGAIAQATLMDQVRAKSMMKQMVNDAGPEELDPMVETPEEGSKEDGDLGGDEEGQQFDPKEGDEAPVDPSGEERVKPPIPGAKPTRPPFPPGKVDPKAAVRDKLAAKKRVEYAVKRAKETGKLRLEWPYNNPEGNNQYTGGGGGGENSDARLEREAAEDREKVGEFRSAVSDWSTGNIEDDIDSFDKALRGLNTNSLSEDAINNAALVQDDLVEAVYEFREASGDQDAKALASAYSRAASHLRDRISAIESEMTSPEDNEIADRDVGTESEFEGSLRLSALSVRASSRRSPFKDQSKRADGSGGTVSCLLAVATKGLEVGHTTGGGKGKVDITSDMFGEMVTNFGKKPGPVSLWFGHASESPRTPETPAAGVVLEVWTESNGEELWGNCDLGPKAWDLVMEQRGFYGHSLEADLNPIVGTGRLKGWALKGGSITNNPALDVHWLAASASQDGPEASLVFSTPLTGEGGFMTQQNPETLQAENTRLEAAVMDGATQLETARGTIAALRAELRESKKGSKDVATLQTALRVLQVKDAERDIDSIVLGAIGEGKPPAFFEGWDKHDGGKVGWLKERFGSVAALRTSVARIPAQAFAKGSSSGANVNGESETTGVLNASQRADLEKSGVDPKEVESILAGLQNK